MSAPDKVIADYSHPDFIVLWPSGKVEYGCKAGDIVAAVKRRDERLARKAGGPVITMIEWRNVPGGFVPPDGAAVRP